MSDDFIGPTPPPHLAKRTAETQQSREETKGSSEGKSARSTAPSPPRKRRRMGPSLDDLVVPPSNQQEAMIGPPLPENLSSADSDDRDDRDRQWDEVMKRNAPDAGSEKKGKREDWMLSLPQSRQQRIPTQSVKAFAKNDVQSSDNSWMLAPGEKAKQASTESEKRSTLPTRTQAPKKAKGPSLLEMHQQRMKSTPKEGEREGWNRERDFLGVGKTMSASKRQEIINQAGEINSRFAPSSH